MEELRAMGLVPWLYQNESKWSCLPFEVLDGNEWRVWARRQLLLCLALCALYLTFVFLGPLLMAKRRAYDLQKALVLWNALLALFSMAGAARMLPQFLDALSKPNGFHRSACDMTEWDYSSTFWGLAFTLSKVAELIDTVFIVLRKKPLIFLHWYHHLSMVWVTFYLFSEGEPVSRWSAVLNFSIHAIMYSYYTLKAMNVKLSRNISMLITSLQILQFLTGISVHLYTQWVLAIGGECFRTSNSLKIYYVIGISYLSLFVKLFYNSYIANPKLKSL